MTTGPVPRNPEVGTLVRCVVCGSPRSRVCGCTAAQRRAYVADRTVSTVPRPVTCFPLVHVCRNPFGPACPLAIGGQS